MWVCDFVRRNPVAYNMMILTVTGIITKTIDFAFRSYYSKQLGAEGMGIFSLIMSVFGIILSLSSAGMGVAVSRLVSIKEEQGNREGSVGVVKSALQTVFCVGAVCVSFVFLFAEWLSQSILNDMRCVTGLLCIAPASLFMGISYCIKGYFYGIRKVIIPAESEFVEQAVKIASISYFLGKGLYIGTEYGCAGVMAGLTIGEFSSCVYLLIRYKFHSKGRKSQGCPVKGILNMTIPMTASAVGNSFFRMIEDVKIIDGFERFGKENAVGEYGLIKGMTMPLIVFPLNLISSFMALLSPEVSRATEKGKFSGIAKRIGKIGLFFGFLVFVIFSAFPEELSLMVYGTTEGAKYIAPLALLCPLMVIDSLSSSMLGGLGEQKKLLKYSLWDSALRLFIVWVILPYLGNFAIILMFFSSNALTCTLTAGKIHKMAESFIPLSSITRAFFCSLIVILLSEIFIPDSLSGAYLIASILAVTALYALLYKKSKS
ncbi:MAG: hypothetical protein E7415_01745 [Ruminococcaceae bacterium]|nr:hypothetical protein [Oscillospiraceae bacterium]